MIVYHTHHLMPIALCVRILETHLDITHFDTHGDMVFFFINTTIG